MVRRWSYIDNFNNFNFDKNLTRSVNKYNFKSFRKTTKFKRYAIGVTKFVRKSFLSRKMKTSYFNLILIAATWSKFYLKYKSKLKNYQLINFSMYAFTSFFNTVNTNVVTINFPATHYKYKNQNIFLTSNLISTQNPAKKSGWYYKHFYEKENIFLSSDPVLALNYLLAKKSDIVTKLAINNVLTHRRILTLLLLKNI